MGTVIGIGGSGPKHFDERVELAYRKAPLKDRMKYRSMSGLAVGIYFTVFMAVPPISSLMLIEYCKDTK